VIFIKVKNLSALLFVSIIATSSVSTTSFATSANTNENKIISTLSTSSNVNDLKDYPDLSDSEKEKLDSWVKYDNDSLTFSIKVDAEKALTSSEYKALEECIEASNYNISCADFSTGEVSVESSLDSSNDNSKISLMSAKKAKKKFINGVNKVEFHWWGVRVYVSRDRIRHIANGAMIGGIWIPELVASKVTATLGVLYSNCPGGVRFDFNYIKGGIKSIKNPAKILVKSIENVRFQ